MSATLAEAGKIVMLTAIAAGIGLHLYREDRKDRAMAAWKVWSQLHAIDASGDQIQQKWQTDWDRMVLQPTPHKPVR